MKTNRFYFLWLLLTACPLSAQSLEVTSTGLNATAIGATTPSAGAFTTLSANNDASFGGSLNIARSSSSAGASFNLSGTLTGNNTQSFYTTATTAFNANGQASELWQSSPTINVGATTGGAYYHMALGTPTLVTSGGSLSQAVQLYVAAPPAATGAYAIYSAGSAQSFFSGPIQAGGLSIGCLNGLNEKLTIVGMAGYTSTILQVGADGDDAIDFRRAGGVQVGNININSTATSYNTASDLRLKTNIRDLSDSGVIIDALQPRLFDWKNGQKDTYGFVAQEVYPIFPQAVAKGDDDPDTIVKQWAIDSSKLVPVLTAEVKSLRARVATLEAASSEEQGRAMIRLTEEVAALRHELTELKAGR